MTLRCVNTEAYRQLGQLITSATYCRLPTRPMPTQLPNTIAQMKKVVARCQLASRVKDITKHIEPARTPHLSSFSKDEPQVVEDIMLHQRRTEAGFQGGIPLEPLKGRLRGPSARIQGVHPRSGIGLMAADARPEGSQDRAVRCTKAKRKFDVANIMQSCQEQTTANLPQQVTDNSENAEAPALLALRQQVICASSQCCDSIGEISTNLYQDIAKAVAAIN